MNGPQTPFKGMGMAKRGYTPEIGVSKGYTHYGTMVCTH